MCTSLRALYFEIRSDPEMRVTWYFDFRRVKVVWYNCIHFKNYAPLVQFSNLITVDYRPKETIRLGFSAISNICARSAHTVTDATQQYFSHKCFLIGFFLCPCGVYTTIHYYVVDVLICARGNGAITAERNNNP